VNTLRTTPLESWIRGILGLPLGLPLTRECVRDYQLQRLQDLLAYASVHSPFYRRRLSESDHLTRLEDLGSIPFTTPDDLARDPLDFLCVSQAEVARVVTLHSSGTTGRPKRVFFVPEDLERTVDFFHHGMSTLVQPGQRVLILLPGGLPGSVADLLVEGLERMGATGIVHGPVEDPESAIDRLLTADAACVIGVPVQVLALARHPKGEQIPYGLFRDVLLSTDYVSDAIVDTLRRTWGCHVYQHYGMTETGYGGGVECDAHAGYHLRETDLLVEIVDPETDRPLPDGVSGEVVATTLFSRAMPLIRYRTGDLARILPDYCPCGSTLRRLGKVRGRRSNRASLGASEWLHMSALDEAVFSVPAVLNFQAELISENDTVHLRATVHCDPLRMAETSRAVSMALAGIPELRDALRRGALHLDPVRLSPANWFTTGAAKRILIDRR
jgi:phenylacetate-CoA ligase